MSSCPGKHGGAEAGFCHGREGEERERKEAATKAEEDRKERKGKEKERKEAAEAAAKAEEEKRGRRENKRQRPAERAAEAATSDEVG